MFRMDDSHHRSLLLEGGGDKHKLPHAWHTDCFSSHFTVYSVHKRGCYAQVEWAR